MGCCYSCDEERPTQNGEANERTHLLVDPVSNSSNIQRVNSDNFLNQYPNSLPKKTDEQSALNRILQETATNVIDVAALDSHNLEQQEYADRIRQYTQRVQQAASNSNIPVLPTPCLLADIPAPEKVLASIDISQDNWDLICSSVAQASAALDDLQVEHKEDLVVPFRIPQSFLDYGSSGYIITTGIGAGDRFVFVKRTSSFVELRKKDWKKDK